MQDQKIGKRCQISQCRQIDWMPMTCKYCSGIFCSDHYSIENHACKQFQKQNRKVIQCPFCLEMIKMSANLTAEQMLSIHEATECHGKQEVRQTLCAKQKCGVKITEVNKFVCPKCSQILCLKHRLQTDHNCVSAAKKKWYNFGSN